mgnify:FL=1
MSETKILVKKIVANLTELYKGGQYDELQRYFDEIHENGVDDWIFPKLSFYDEFRKTIRAKKQEDTQNVSSELLSKDSSASQNGAKTGKKTVKNKKNSSATEKNSSASQSGLDDLAKFLSTNPTAEAIYKYRDSHTLTAGQEKKLIAALEKCENIDDIYLYLRDFYGELSSKLIDIFTQKNEMFYLKQLKKDVKLSPLDEKRVDDYIALHETLINS